MTAIKAFKCTGCGALKDPATENVLGIQLLGRLFVAGEETQRLSIPAEGAEPEPFCSWHCLATYANGQIATSPQA